MFILILSAIENPSPPGNPSIPLPEPLQSAHQFLGAWHPQALGNHRLQFSKNNDQGGDQISHGSSSQISMGDMVHGPESWDSQLEGSSPHHIRCRARHPAQRCNSNEFSVQIRARAPSCTHVHPGALSGPCEQISALTNNDSDDLEFVLGPDVSDHKM